MAYDGRAVANFILDYCDARDREISNLALQKILYFCHVWFLIERKEPLLKHQFEAWEFGPVLQYLYRDFKSFENSPIVSRARSIDAATGEKKAVEYEFDAATTALLERVVDFYSRLRASDLVNLSHVRGGPWDQVWNHEGKINPGMKIDNESIRSFYVQISAPFTVQ